MPKFIELSAKVSSLFDKPEVYISEDIDNVVFTEYKPIKDPNTGRVVEFEVVEHELNITTKKGIMLPTPPIFE